MRNLFALTIILSAAVAMASSLLFITPLKQPAVAGWNPATEPTLALLLDGNRTSAMNGGSITDGTGVQTYVDPSANAATFSQATSGQRPLYKANIIDGRGVFRFASISAQYLLETSTQLVTSGSPFTIVFVANVSTFAGANGSDKALMGFMGAASGSSPVIWVNKSGSSFPGISLMASVTFTANPTYSTSGLSTGTWYEYKIVYNGGTASTVGNYAIEVNRSSVTTSAGIVQSWSNDQQNIFGGWKSSGNTGFCWDGDIALVAMFSSNDSTLQTNINSWLASNFPSI